MHRIAQFASSSQLSPLISKELKECIEKPIEFTSMTSVAKGYEATILVDICDAVIEARKIGVLQKQQRHIADRAELLMRAFAKVGIIALIDEATGFQEEREKTALKQFLEKFLKEEKGKWIKTFDDSFFEAIFRMKGWDWETAAKGQKPGVVGTYINNYVWARIAPGVLRELKRINPKDENGKRKGKNPQFIDTDFGHPKLKEHINLLTVLAKASGYNWANWDRMINRALPKFESDGSAAQELDFPED